MSITLFDFRSKHFCWQENLNQSDRYSTLHVFFRRTTIENAESYKKSDRKLFFSKLQASTPRDDSV